MLAEEILNLYLNRNQRKRMGEIGRKQVAEKYELNYCFRRIEEIYQKISNTGDIG